MALRTMSLYHPSIDNPGVIKAILQALVDDCRRHNHKSRAVSLLKNCGTGTIRQMQCILCGACGPTSSKKYPETMRSIHWSEAHCAGHVNQVAEVTVDHQELSTAVEILRLRNAFQRKA